MNDIEKRIYQRVNQYLSNRRIPLLNLSKNLSKIARSHSEYMAAKQVISHDNFQSRNRLICSIYKTCEVAENVAYNLGSKDPATEAVQSWLNSKQHHQNIVSGYRITGIGVVKNIHNYYFFTQLFIK